VAAGEAERDQMARASTEAKDTLEAASAKAAAREEALAAEVAQSKEERARLAEQLQVCLYYYIISFC